MTGRTVEEAKDAALDELGVDEADAEFEILEEPRQGLFGRQRGEARVRARVRPTAPRPKVERRDRKRRSPGSRDVGSAPSSSPGSTTATASASADSTGGSNRGGGARARSGARKPPPGSSGPEASEGSDTGREEADVTEELSIAEQGEVARQFVVGLLEQLHMPAEVRTAEVDEDTVEVRVTGPELGLLIGPKGLTLSALQELTRTVVQRRSGGRSGRAVVD